MKLEEVWLGFDIYVNNDTVDLLKLQLYMILVDLIYMFSDMINLSRSVKLLELEGVFA